MDGSAEKDARGMMGAGPRKVTVREGGHTGIGGCRSEGAGHRDGMPSSQTAVRWITETRKKGEWVRGIFEAYCPPGLHPRDSIRRDT